MWNFSKAGYKLEVLCRASLQSCSWLWLAEPPDTDAGIWEIVGRILTCSNVSLPPTCHGSWNSTTGESIIWVKSYLIPGAFKKKKKAQSVERHNKSQYHLHLNWFMTCLPSFYQQTFTGHLERAGKMPALGTWHQIGLCSQGVHRLAVRQVHRWWHVINPVQGIDKQGANGVYPSRRRGSCLPEEVEKTSQDMWCAFELSLVKKEECSLQSEGNRIGEARQPEALRKMPASWEGLSESDHGARSWVKQERLGGT